VDGALQLTVFGGIFDGVIHLATSHRIRGRTVSLAAWLSFSGSLTRRRPMKILPGDRRLPGNASLKEMQEKARYPRWRRWLLRSPRCCRRDITRPPRVLARHQVSTTFSLVNLWHQHSSRHRRRSDVCAFVGTCGSGVCSNVTVLGWLCAAWVKCRPSGTNPRRGSEERPRRRSNSPCSVDSERVDRPEPPRP